MNYDPVYRKIVELLNGPIDGTKFEECANFLLGDVYPNLAPVAGGGDDGMDGAFGTAAGAFPLICTTQSDVLGNFRENITTFLEKRSGPARAVLATTQSLTPLRKRNIEDEAARLGVTIVNIHDQPDFANRLYRNAKWRMELLGVPGDLPALSVLPLRARYMAPELVVGRDEFLEWLRATPGDLLVVGNPGAGKTCLHQYLAAGGFCLFAVDEDTSRLADAIREQQPTVIVVDDAHTRLDLLMALKRLRLELRTAFTIHANCWPSHDGAVRRCMGIPIEKCNDLEPLTRETIVQLIEQCGIVGPEALMHLLLDQADGKPGLAVAIVEACKRGGVDRVWSGEELAEMLLENRELVRDERDRAVLAAFALGGDAGMSLSTVAQALSLPSLDVRAITTGLGAGGIVEEVGTDRLQVRPPVLRGLLVRDVFFLGAHSLDATPLLKASRSAGATAHVLIDAYQRNAKVPFDLICQFAEAANQRDVWNHLGWADERFAKTIIGQFPTHITDAAPGLLHFAPHETLAMLLASDDPNQTDAKRAREQRRQPIHEWLVPYPAAPGDAAARRQQLLTALEEQWANGQLSPESCAWALAEILRVDFHLTRAKPGSGHTVVLTRGILPTADISEICELWPKVLQLLSQLPRPAQRAVLDSIENWCFPGRFLIQNPVDADVLALLNSHAQRMLKDVLALPSCGQACRMWVSRITVVREFERLIDEPVGLLATLFAERDHATDWQEEAQRRYVELEELAERIVARPIEDAVADLASVEQEVIEFGGLAGGYDRANLYLHIAQKSADAKAWLEGLVAHQMKSEFVAPFLHTLSRTDDDATLDSSLYLLLNNRIYCQLAAIFTLQLASASEALLQLALDRITPPDQNRDHMFIGLKMPIETVERLLRHTDPRLRSAAVIGEWLREPKGNVRTEVATAWRAALMDVDGDEYFLEEMFRHDGELAFEWSAARIGGAHRDLWKHDRGVQAAADLLNREQRRNLLRLFNRDNYHDDCFDLLLKDDVELFRDWLIHQPDQYVRLRPLDRVAGPRWESLALIALEAGISPRELSEHCTPNRWGGMGPMSEHFRAIMPQYERLAAHPDYRLRLAGQRGLNWVKETYASERRREHFEAVRGH